MKVQSQDKQLIGKIRRKIVTLITCLTAAIFIVVDLTYSSYLYLNEKNQVNNILDKELSVAEGNIKTTIFQQNPGNPPEFDSIRIFSIAINKEDNSVKLLKGGEYFSNFINLNINNFINDSDGNIDDIFYKSKITNSTIFVTGIDQTIEMKTIRTSILTTTLVLSSGVLLIFILSFFLTKLILKPIQDAQTKQKEFISDASHELKTPLTIIDANASILKNGNENNKWVNNILNESKNMAVLINDMLGLASVEEKETILEEFDLSDAVNNIALTFDAICYENNIDYELKIQEGINIKGNKKDIEKIVKILIDNSRKYVDKNGIIQITLLSEKNNTYLSVYNSGCTIKDDERKKIFDRFYRDSISRDGENKHGSGLGLAILKEIAEKYNYSIVVDSKENVFFKITITF